MRAKLFLLMVLFTFQSLPARSFFNEPDKTDKVVYAEKV